MANNYFKFKQFSISQDHCAMKVGTDGVLLGAWADISFANNVLDVGTGTGLIALMLAQRNLSLYIDAIDIDNAAIKQAEDNIKHSPFGGRVKSYPLSLQQMIEKTDKKYDAIVSNPPYFINSLKSPDAQRSLARHTDSLSVDELIALSSRLLSDKGRLSIIFPYEYTDDLMGIAEKNGLYTSRVTTVFPTPTSLPKRILLEFSRENITLVKDVLTIERERHVYTEEFTSLVKEFYLKM